jgi:hypothetical protein
MNQERAVLSGGCFWGMQAICGECRVCLVADEPRISIPGSQQTSLSDKRAAHEDRVVGLTLSLSQAVGRIIFSR